MWPFCGQLDRAQKKGQLLLSKAISWETEGVSSGAVALFSSEDFAVRRVSLPPRQVVFLRHLLEASEGLGFLVAESGGELFVVSPLSQEQNLNSFLQDLSEEVDLQIHEFCSSVELERLMR